MSGSIYPVILSGGAGTRLWPLSRSMRPKQFIDLTGGQSLFQKTLLRTAHIDTMNPTIVCNDEHRFMVTEQMRELNIEPHEIILETTGKNTAPAAAAAAFKLLRSDGNAVMFVLPADHLIDGTAAGFAAAVRAARLSAAEGRLVTFGVTPDHPSTGYGYIKADSGFDAAEARKVTLFVEKPDEQTAQKYLDDGGYYWNSGMFMFRASDYLSELKRFRPRVYKAVEAAVDRGRDDLDFFRLDHDACRQCENVSVDYAVMEHSDSISMVPLDAGWSDIGSWSSLWKTGDRDGSGNVTRGDVWIENVTDSYIHSENRMIAAMGIENLVIVETHDGIMVAPKENDREISQFVSRLKRAGRPEAELHRKTFRPWGCYDCLDSGPGFQVKRITVKEGQCTSTQKHFKRAEHWVVVSGIAEVTRGEDVFILNENESTFIPPGTKHRLKNPGDAPLELIEVQSGSYLGEDDIERIDDEYGRA